VASRRGSRSTSRHLVLPEVARRTPRISCEAVPAPNPTGAGMSRHLRPRNGAGESFVSFIRLFCGPLLIRLGPDVLVVGSVSSFWKVLTYDSQAIPAVDAPLIVDHPVVDIGVTKPVDLAGF
jgi:hypothetical protein